MFIYLFICISISIYMCIYRYIYIYIERYRYILVGPRQGARATAAGMHAKFKGN